MRRLQVNVPHCIDLTATETMAGVAVLAVTAALWLTGNLGSLSTAAAMLIPVYLAASLHSRRGRP